MNNSSRHPESRRDEGSPEDSTVLDIEDPSSSFAAFRMTWIVCGVLLFASVAFSQVTLNQDYTLLPVITPQKQGKPIIVEFFSFGCPACFHLEKTLTPWLKAHEKDIQFFRVPVVYHAGWDLYAKAYYAAVTLKVLPKAIPALFKAIQVDKLPLATDGDFIAFFVKQFKLPEEVVAAVFHSPALDKAVKEGMVKTARLGITRIPAFTINGRYLTDLYLFKSPERLGVVLEGLIKPPI